jgi:hypothetical protein
MAPLLRRSWAPCGQTPVLHHRTRHREKVSLIAALCIPPSRDSVQLYFRIHPYNSIRSGEVTDFLRVLDQTIDGPWFLMWDRLKAHRSVVVQDYLSSTTRLHAASLPSYAPELNPVEFVWSYLKINPLANLAAGEHYTLTRLTRRHARSVQHRVDLLRSFVQHGRLSLRLS